MLKLLPEDINIEDLLAYVVKSIDGVKHILWKYIIQTISSNMEFRVPIGILVIVDNVKV